MFSIDILHEINKFQYIYIYKYVVYRGNNFSLFAIIQKIVFFTTLISCIHNISVTKRSIFRILFIVTSCVCKACSSLQNTTCDIYVFKTLVQSNSSRFSIKQYLCKACAYQLEHVGSGGQLYIVNTINDVYIFLTIIKSNLE